MDTRSWLPEGSQLLVYLYNIFKKLLFLLLVCQRIRRINFPLPVDVQKAHLHCRVLVKGILAIQLHNSSFAIDCSLAHLKASRRQLAPEPFPLETLYPVKIPLIAFSVIFTREMHSIVKPLYLALLYRLQVIQGKLIGSRRECGL